MSHININDNDIWDNVYQGKNQNENETPKEEKKKFEKSIKKPLNIEKHTPREALNITTSPDKQNPIPIKKTNPLSTVILPSGESLNIAPSEKPNPSPERTTSGFEKRNQTTSKKGLSFVKKIQIDQPCEIQTLLDVKNNTTSNPIWSRKNDGYISLVAYMRALDVTKIGNQSGYNSKNNFNVHKKSLNLEEGTDKWRPTHQLKNADLWDSKSLEAYENKIRTALNSLTNETIPDIFLEITEDLNPETMKQFSECLINELIERSIKELKHSLVYANLIKLMKNTYPDMVQNITDSVYSNFRDFVLNPPKNQSQEQQTIGIAQFIGSLIQAEVVDSSYGIYCVNNLLDKIKSNNLTTLTEKDEYIFEMLLNLIADAGSHFTHVLNYNKENNPWETIKKLRVTINQQHIQFYLADTLALYEEWIEHKEPTGIKMPIKFSTDQIISSIRSFFSIYQETNEISKDSVMKNIQKIGVNNHAYMNGLFLHLPDVQFHDIDLFSYFFAEISTFMQIPPKIFIDIFHDNISKYKEDNIDADCPNIWKMLDICMCQCILKETLSANDVTYIHNNFFPFGNYDVVNAMKFFLTTYYFFDKPLSLPSFPSFEVQDALLMPEIIKKNGLKLRMSRLISVALERSIASRIREQPEAKLDVQSFLPYKQYISQVVEKNQKKAFEEALYDDMDFSGDFLFEDSQELFNYLNSH